MSGIEILMALAIGYLGGNAVGKFLDGYWITGILTVVASVFVFYQVFYG